MGTIGDGTIVGSRRDDTIVGDDSTDTINGNAGNDLIVTEDGNDLVAGDLLGNEWIFVDGVWVYDPSRINHSAPLDYAYDDIIIAGGGDDIILGNGGNDHLSGDNGHDLINAGTGHDTVFGGKGEDVLNLEDGDDLAEGGHAADTINAGDGNDLVYGDDAPRNLLAADVSDAKAISFSQFESGGNWTVTTTQDGQRTMSQTLDVERNLDYRISFDLAANLAAGATSGRVEVFWDEVSLGVFEATSGVFETVDLSVTASSGTATLAIREVEPATPTGPELKQTGDLWTYDRDVTIGGQDVTVSAFAPGQARLYQIISGQLKMFDTEAEVYSDLGPPTGIKTNAIGYNREDDLIYGVAKSAGIDALGNAVGLGDVIMMDATGSAFRVGASSSQYFVGDFDSDGNLWTFHQRLDKIKVLDVGKLGDGGRVKETVYDMPEGLMSGNMYDIAYAAEENAFYAITPPGANGGNGTVLRIDLSDIGHGGAPRIDTVSINRTLFGAEFRDGMPKGAFGAVFRDGDGNLYFGLNSGDHDLDGASPAQGGIYRLHIDWTGGAAYAQFMAEAVRTGANDGAVDPRSGDAFAQPDAEAPVLIRSPKVEADTGGDDVIRGARGEDRIFGGQGADDIHGGAQGDELHGDSGGDKINGGAGDDLVYGGTGRDLIVDTGGNDTMFGGAGNDYAHGGTGDDMLSGDAGTDKLVGGAGADIISGGLGNDHLWGGDFAADGGADVFVFGPGDGRDHIHDFEVGTDRIDLTGYGIDFAQLSGVMRAHNGNTVLKLHSQDGGQPGDRVILVGVDVASLSADDFLL